MLDSILSFSQSSPGLAISSERGMIVDYSMPVFAWSYVIAIRNPLFEINLWNYVTPFHFHSWIAVIVLIGVSALSLALVCKTSRGKEIK